MVAEEEEEVVMEEGVLAEELVAEKEGELTEEEEVAEKQMADEVEEVAEEEVADEEEVVVPSSSSVDAFSSFSRACSCRGKPCAFPIWGAKTKKTTSFYCVKL